jgi:hypothetical protein
MKTNFDQINIIHIFVTNLTYKITNKIINITFTNFIKIFIIELRN